ncbi:MAG: hypothetical protein FWD01_03105 [Defluviitaleaceae bacterium]|nr:hypothetical protein [Defluviitaleaceae bacterium]
MKEISVYDKEDKFLGITFPRRAKNLISKGRAKWTDETQCSIILQEIEIVGIDDEEFYDPNDPTNEIYQTLETYEEYEPAYPIMHETSEVNEELLLHIASENVKRRRRFYLSLAGFPIALILSTILHDVYVYNVPHNIFNFQLSIEFWRGFIWGAFVLWGIYLICRFSLIFKERIESKFWRDRPDPIETEFNRLKSMSK